MSEYNPFSLNGKKIIITGASSGIGRQCAIDCSKMGATEVLIGRDESSLQETLSQMEGEGAIVSAVKTMALELAKCSVRINAVSPGTVLTPLMQSYLSQISEEERQKRVVGSPLGLGETTDVSNTCIFLLSDAPRWITGQKLIVDGGFTIQ